MRTRRPLAILTLALLLLPAIADAGERSRRESFPSLDTARILEILARPWILLWRAPEPDVNKGGGTMDPNGNPTSDD